MASRTFAALIFTISIVAVAFAQEAPTKFPPLRGFQNFQSPSSSAGSLKIAGKFVQYEGTNKGELQITVDVSPGWHIFSLTQPKGGPPKTQIELQPSDGFKVTSDFRPNKKPIRVEPGVFPVHQEYHEGQVIWTAPVDFNGTPESLSAAGELKGQICSESSCLPLSATDTTFTVTYGGITKAPTEPQPTGEEEAQGAVPFSWDLLLTNIGYGLLGGLILNLMPCVLPVIGLKLMSFVEQAQGNRWQAMKLNIIYTLGILSVFVVLANMAVFLNLGWGEHFTNTPFKVSMVILVFAMALSFLGVWEIPIPGFVGRGSSEKLASSEGATGAFFKGVFTTILATPCSGPFLGPVFAYTVKQPPGVTYAIMMSVGLGLSLPYLIIGAFPELIRWIPKPGAWMDTFKQLMGFVLLGTTVYLFSTLNDDLFLAVLATIFGVWFGCWYIGRIPITASFDRRLSGWIGGAVLMGAIGFASFQYLTAKESHLEWQPFSPEAVASATQQGKTVLVDFTADWCLTCKLNLARAIDTEPVGDLVAELGVVPMIADYTDHSDVIKNALSELDSVSIPLLAIYPANNPTEPIILRDVLTQAQVLEAIEAAGPSTTTVATPQRF